MHRKLFYVYVHRNGVTGEVFYVGKGTGCRSESSAGRNQKWHVVKSEVGFKPEIVHQFSDEDLAFQLEKDLIKHYRAVGAPLVNMTGGGQGPCGAKRSEETKRLMSEIRKRRGPQGPHSEEHKEKLRQANAGKKMSPEAIARTVAAHKGAKRSPESIERMRVAQANCVRAKAEWTNEMRAALSAKKKGVPLSDQARANMSAGSRGKKKRPQSPEHIAKRVAAFKLSIDARRASKSKA